MHAARATQAQLRAVPRLRREKFGDSGDMAAAMTSVGRAFAWNVCFAFLFTNENGKPRAIETHIV